MSKKVTRSHKHVSLIRLLSSLFVGGVLLFQGTGYITSSLLAADSNQNINVNDLTEARELTDSTNNYGLIGSSLTQNLSIYNGVSAVIGQLDDSGSSLDPTNAQNISLTTNESQTGNLTLGSSDTDGTLYVTGPTSGAASTLSILSGSSMSINYQGLLAIGGETAKGTVTVADGGKLTNNGYNDASYGILIDEKGTLTFDAGSIYDAGGLVTNSGVINNNGAYLASGGTDQILSLSDYIDTAEGVINSDSYELQISRNNEAGLTLNGTVNAGKNLMLSSLIAGTDKAGTVLLESGSRLNAGGKGQLVSVLGYDSANTTYGADLTIDSDDAAAGGLDVTRVGDVGGALSVTNDAALTITGLENKFNASGIQTADGLYDINLGYSFTNTGTVYFGEYDAEAEEWTTTINSGIRFTGASAYDEGAGTLGFNNSGTIMASGDLNLYGIDLNSSQTGHETLTAANNGTIDVAGDLTIDAEDTLDLTNGGTGKINVGGDFLFKGTDLTNENGAVITVADGNMEINNEIASLTNSGAINLDSTAANSGNFTFSGSSLTNHGTISLDGTASESVANTGVFAFNGSEFNNSVDSSNYDEVNITADNIVITAETFNNTSAYDEDDSKEYAATLKTTGSMTLNLSDTGSTSSNKGTIDVAADLTINGTSATGVAKLSNQSQEFEGEETTYVGGEITVGGKLAFNGGENGLKLTNAATISAHEMTLNDANVEIYNDPSSTGVLKVNEMTLLNGSIAGKLYGQNETVEEGDEETVDIGSITVGSAENDATQITLTGNTSIGTVKTSTEATDEKNTLLTLTNKGAITGDYTLTFNDVDVVNNTSLTDGSGINVKEIIFNSGATYSYTGVEGGNILGGDTTFEIDYVFDADKANPLYLAEGKSLTAVDGSIIKLGLDDFNGDTALITLKENGDLSGAADIAATIQLDNDYTQMKSGSYKATVVRSFSEESDYDDVDLASVNSLFLNTEGKTVEENGEKNYAIEMNVKGFSDFAKTPNQTAAAGYVDRLRTNGFNCSGELKGFVEDVMKLDDKTGDAFVSSLLDVLSGANRANAMAMAMSDPWQFAFDRMSDSTHRQYIPQGCSSCRGQMEDGYYYEDAGYAGYGTPMPSIFNFGQMTSPKSTWATFHAASVNARSDENSGDYGFTRTGVALGYDVVRGDNVTAGMTFNYAQPHLYSAWDYQAQTVDQSNFNLGLYGRRDFWNGMHLSAYVGGGLLDMKSRRHVNFGESYSFADTYRSNTTGGSLAASIKLARDFSGSGWLVLRPFVQFDMQQVWLGSSEEEGRAISLAYDKTDWNRTFVRAGLETETNTQFVRLTTRALYANQLGGDTAPEMDASFVGDYSNDSMTIYGVDLGKSYFDAGVGALGYLDCNYQWSISGNYDFAASEKSTGHTGSVTLGYAF